MKTIIVTFGWTEAPVISAVVRHGLEAGDRIVLLRPSEEDERSVKAASDLRSFLSNVQGVELIDEIINVRDFVSSVISIKEILEKEQGRRVIVNLSGGMRILVLAAYVASLFSKGNVELLEVDAENRRFRVSLPLIDLPLLMELKNKPRLLEVLRFLRDGKPLNVIEEDAGIPRSTAYWQVKELERMRLVERRGIGRRKAVNLTKAGELAVALLVS